MAKKQSVKKKSPAKRKPKPKQKTNKPNRPIFGFWYPDNPEVDEEGNLVHTHVLLKDCSLKHIIEDECEEGYWGE